MQPMMVLQFYFSPVSPPSRTPLMTLKALGLDFEEKICNNGEERTSDFLAMNPRGKLPCLKDGDFAIAESRAISAYLCNKFESGDDSERLYPVACDARGIVDQMLYLSINMSEIIKRYVNVSGVLFRGENTNKQNFPELKKVLDLYETYLNRSEYIAGNHLTIADFYMSSPILMLSLPGYDYCKEFPKTGFWMSKIKALPYFDECNKQALDVITQKYRTALSKNAGGI